MVYVMKFNTDGGCRENGNAWARGAAAAVRFQKWGKPKEMTQKLPKNPPATSPRAELTGIILALSMALDRYEKLHSSPRIRVTIQSDSQYAVKCMEDWVKGWTDNGWISQSGSPVANQDLLKRCLDLDSQLRALGRVSYVWISRQDNDHANRLCNEILDDWE
jgi:ribonuclease HI